MDKVNIEVLADSYTDSIIHDVLDGSISWDNANEKANQLAWEYADGSEYVIYYYKAHELVATLSQELRDRAEYMREEICQGDYGTYDDIATQLAFCALYTAIQDSLDERLTTEFFSTDYTQDRDLQQQRGEIA